GLWRIGPEPAGRKGGHDMRGIKALRRRALTRPLGAVAAAMVLVAMVFVVPASANTNLGLSGSCFEIDQDANLKLDSYGTSTDGTDVCAGNGVTPARVAGDELVTYDLSQGGTHPTISLRTWSGSAWGAASILSTSTTPSATGSVNTTSIPPGQSGGLCSLTG